jgi:hypothetical protein
MSNGISLYELAESYQNVLDLDLDDETASQILGQIEDAVEVKVENIGLARRGIDSEIDVLKAEIKRLQDRKKSLEKKSDWLKDYAFYAMKQFNIDKIKGTRLTVWIQNNPPSLEVIDETKVPDCYKEPQPDKIDKKGLLDMIKSMGEEDVAKLEYVKLTQSEGIRFK